MDKSCRYLFSEILQWTRVVDIRFQFLSQRILDNINLMVLIGMVLIFHVSHEHSV